LPGLHYPGPEVIAIRAAFLTLAVLVAAAHPLLAAGSVQANTVICTGQDAVVREGSEFLVAFTSPDPRVGSKFFILASPDGKLREHAGIWEKHPTNKEPNALRYQAWHCKEYSTSGAFLYEYDRIPADLPVLQTAMAKVDAAT